MVAGCIVAGYSIYAVFVGTANGRQEFHKQAGLDITMATVRAVGILGSCQRWTGALRGYRRLGCCGGSHFVGVELCYWNPVATHEQGECFIQALVGVFFSCRGLFDLAQSNHVCRPAVTQEDDGRVVYGPAPGDPTNSSDP